VPDEGLGIVVPELDPGTDRGDEFADGSMGAARDPLAGELGDRHIGAEIAYRIGVPGSWRLRKRSRQIGA